MRTAPDTGRGVCRIDPRLNLRRACRCRASATRAWIPARGLQETWQRSGNREAQGEPKTMHDLPDEPFSMTTSTSPAVTLPPTSRPGGVPGPFSASGTAGPPSPTSSGERRAGRADDRTWVQWRRQIGRRLRALRELTGLSQSRLAQMAGTNQAAISRLESGTGLVPLSLLARIAPALAGSVIDRSALSPEGERLLSALEVLGPTSLEQWLPVASDTGLEELVRCYLHASLPERKRIVTVVKALGIEPPRNR
jgi:transcriptional regulator with XRE-family HTH domain